MKIQNSGNSDIRYTGTGPGEQTLDGCSVEFYLKLPPAHEPDIIAAAVAAGSTILELGCGVGRLTTPLVERGYKVTAVDNSAEMLEHVEVADRILSDIESLEINSTFDVVLLASRILNAPLPEVRRSLLRTARRHLAPGSQFLAEIHTPGILELKTGDASQNETYAGEIRHAKVDGNHATITIQYTIGEERWTQSFETVYLAEDEVVALLQESGFRFDGWIDEAKSWLRAVAE